jgi:polysaccharide chain length determinant protein (PEP-CTERM system associated)
MRPFTPEDYKEIWDRRKWWFVAGVFIVAAGTALVAALLPKVYTSQCLILLEGQPVGSDTNAGAQRPGGDQQTEQQLQMLIQQALSRTRLEQIMHDSGYVSPADSVSDTQLDEFRDKININMLKDKDPRHNSAPYGFEVTYSDHNPKKAQRITNALASFVVSERLKSQEQAAKESNQFLDNQLEVAAKDVTEKQRALSDFKTRYAGQLPVDEQLNVQSLVRLQAQLQESQQAAERARGEIAAIENPPDTAATTSTHSSPDSPLAKLNGNLGTLKAKLADLLSRDTPSHPDVVKTRAEIARIQAEIAAEQAAQAKTADADPKKAANVTGSNATRLADAQAQIVTRQAEQKRIQDDIRRYQQNLELIPIHGQQFTEFERAYQDSKTTFDTLKKKVDDARLANDMKLGLQGQRFRIQDFASLPDKPASPVYWKINLGGLGGALLVGILVAGFIEFRDTTMKSERDVEYYLQTKNLTTVPVLVLPAETQQAQRRKRMWIVGTLPAVLLIAGLLGYLYLVRM